VNRREQIRMSVEEVDSFLEEQRVVICASNGPQGWPHLMPLWYLVRDHEVWAWTYAKSQKVRNLERDPRATLQVEDGHEYEELRGLMIEAHTLLHRDTDRVAELGAELFRRYGSAPALSCRRRSVTRLPSAWPCSSCPSGSRAGTTASSRASTRARPDAWPW
jgi:general stress protein 26